MQTRFSYRREGQEGVGRSPFHGQSLPTQWGMTGCLHKHVAHCVFPTSWMKAEASFLPNILRMIFFFKFHQRNQIKMDTERGSRGVKAKGKSN